MLYSNIFKMHLLKAIMWFMVAMPIIVLFFQEHGLSLSEVMILQAIYSIAVALFEIPSGYIADVFGRKKTIILSTIFCFVGYLIFSSYSNFYLFAIAEIFVGIGGSLMSGADSALIYDTLLESKREESYTKIEGKNYAIGNFSESIAGVFGGFLAVSSIYMPVYVQTIVLFFSIPIAFSLVEPTINRVNKKIFSFKSITSIVKFSMIDHLKLKWLIIYSSVMGLGTLSMAWFAQPFFKEINLPLIYFGVLWAGLNFSAGITSFNSHYFYKNKGYKILIILSLLMSSSFLILGFNSSLLGLLFIFFIYLLRGIITPILRTEININTSSNKRATVLSIRSFIIRISFAILAPILAYISEIYSLAIVFYILALIIGFFSLLSSYKLIYLD